MVGEFLSLLADLYTVSTCASLGQVLPDHGSIQLKT